MGSRGFIAEQAKHHLLEEIIFGDKHHVVVYEGQHNGTGQRVRYYSVVEHVLPETIEEFGKALAKERDFTLEKTDIYKVQAQLTGK